MRVAIVICAGALLQSVAASAASQNERSLSINLRSLSMGLRSLSMRQDGGDDEDNDGGDNDGGDDNGGNDDGETPEDKYLDRVCFNLSQDTPCTVFEELERECQANGSAPIDILAEQECICGSDSYFDMLFACNNCMKVHGGTENENFFDTSIINSASSAFCTGTPVTEFDILLDVMLETVFIPTTTGTDLFPSETAVSFYYTGKIETNPGQITGSATLAVASASFTSGFVQSTDSDDSPSFFAQTTAPTHTGSSSPSSTGTSTGSSTGSSTGNSTGTSASASATGNAASDGNAASGLLQGFAALMGVIYML